MDRLKEAEPWPFEDVPFSTKGGKTGLPNAKTSSDDDKTMKCWCRLSGLDGSNDNAREGCDMANGIEFAKSYTGILDEVYQRAAVPRCLSSGKCMVHAGRKAKERSPYKIPSSLFTPLRVHNHRLPRLRPV
ncbi:MAG: hypothetical protein Q4B54_10585 [Coriobacteriales bacterium]|nr:hypothetical protein [Coriobacteriales bacterium]